MRNFLFLLFIGLAAAFTSCGQSSSGKSSGFVEHNGIGTSLHEANIGQIRFASDRIAYSDNQESDFLSSFEILGGKDLRIRVFLGNSLTNYLHELDPSLTSEELVAKGNYQFSFYVDEKLIYTENLHPNAGLPRQKNEFTSYTVPLLSAENEDSWGRYLWMRFYYRGGGQAALETGSHKMKIELRPYLENTELVVGDIIAEGSINIEMGDPPSVSEELISIQPIEPYNGWELSDASYDEEKIKSLNERIAQNVFKSITSIVVIKEGKLLIEEYFNGADRNTLHDTRSVGKTFASTMAGVAIDEGHLTSTDQTLIEFYDLKNFDNYSSKKDQVTLKSLLTMSSAFDGTDSDYDSPGHEEHMYPTDNWVKFTLDLAMDDNKDIGMNWDYFTAGVVVLGDIIDKSVPGGLEDYAEEKLFKPLGISDYKWQYTPQDVPNTAGGIQLNALDFAKYGQLYKNNGIWNGARVLSEDWVDKSFTDYFPGPENEGAYGFLFWNQEFSANGNSYNAFLCNGNGGNKIIVFTDEPLVIVVTATAYGMPYGHSQVEKMIEEYLLPAVLE